jgi:hypothetical protein
VTVQVEGKASAAMKWMRGGRITAVREVSVKAEHSIRDRREWGSKVSDESLEH